MKVSKLWLKTLIKTSLNTAEIADKLTNAGIEVDQVEMEAGSRQGIFTLKVPPNRGDCLSMEGVARELAALLDQPFQPLMVTDFIPNHSETLTLRVEEPELCPHYAGCKIKNIHVSTPTPNWLKEKIETAGIRSNSLIVDIMNYVMLELGQPLHAFDVATVDTEIVIRKAKSGESIALLDNQTITLKKDTLVIADKSKVLAIAGVMGGLTSSVTEKTTDIWIESAYFDPIAVRLAAKEYGLKTDASFRFERGVDPSLQRRAMLRAVQLVLEIAGGSAGALLEQKSETLLPKQNVILLRKERIRRILGMTLLDNNIVQILQRLGMQVEREGETFKVTPPVFRSDITLEVDLIEEIARLSGFQHIKTQQPAANLLYYPIPETVLPTNRFKEILIDRGYYEAITYSFIDPLRLQLFDETAKPWVLANPISAEMAAMRVSLWPGLCQALQYNQNRQRDRIRLFEMGTCFLEENGKIIEKQMLSGVAMGTLMQEQWGVPAKSVDFYDVKRDLEALFSLVGLQDFSFEKSERPQLHPGQTAAILRAGKEVGVLGSLHPRILKALSLEGSVVAFELDLARVQSASIPTFHPISKFPAIRRDIAILVDEGVLASELKTALVEVVGESLQQCILFDVYQGKGIAPGKKSMAIGLILQHLSRTLVEEEVNLIMQGVLAMLSSRFQAILRE